MFTRSNLLSKCEGENWTQICCFLTLSFSEGTWYAPPESFEKLKLFRYDSLIMSNNMTLLKSFEVVIWPFLAMLYLKVNFILGTYNCLENSPKKMRVLTG